MTPRVHRTQSVSAVFCPFFYHLPSAKHHCKLRLPERVAQLSQRDRAAGWVSYGQKWKTGTGRQYLRTIKVYSLFNYYDVFGQQRNRNRRKKRKIRAITPFKLIQNHPRSSRSVPIESPYATMRLPISD